METLMEEMYARISKTKELLITKSLGHILGREPSYSDANKVNIIKIEHSNKEWYQYDGKTFGYYWIDFNKIFEGANKIDSGFRFETNESLDRKVVEEKQAKEENRRLPKYNPDFIKGKPKEAGWYLVARRSNDVKENYYIIQAWFNPMTTPNWWVGGGYVSNKSEPLEWQGNVVAYAPIPEYKL